MSRVLLFDIQGWITLVLGVLLALITLFSSYSHVHIPFSGTVALDQQIGVLLLVALVPAQFGDAELRPVVDYELREIEYKRREIEFERRKTAHEQRMKQKGVRSERTLLLPNQVDLESIRPHPVSERAHNPHRQELDQSETSIVLMYSGSMNNKQGLEILVDATQRLSAQPNLVWLLAGGGPNKEELIHATAGLPQVRHLPLQPAERMADWLNAADIHLLPQKAGAADLVLPSKLLGILASGRPLVASSPEGSKLALLAGQAGRCVPPGDAAAFADALQELIESAVLRAQCGRLARQLAEEHFGQDSVLQRFEQQRLALHS